MNRFELLTHFIAAYPAQPATAFWRAVEIGALAEVGLPEGRGLDLGCGDGKLTDILLGLTGPRRLVGVDPDPLETEAARRFSFYEAVHTAPGDSIPEATGSFDFVISNSVLEHIPGLEPVIAEVGRLLRPGGQFLFTAPAPPFHENLTGALAPGCSRTRYLETLDKRLAHFNYLSAEDWTVLCGRHGLQVDECLGYLDEVDTRRWETLSRMTGGLLYSLGGGRLRPIEIQRKLGARALQNATVLPSPVAGVFARAVSLGLSDRDEAEPWTDAATASCLLVRGRRA